MVAHAFMRTGIVTVSPSLSLSDLEQLLTGEEISGAPVTDDEGRLVGIVSKTDIVRHYSQVCRIDSTLSEIGEAASVEEIMTRDVVEVARNAAWSDVARVMVDGGVHRVVVVDGGKLEGVITSLDLLRAAVDAGSVPATR